MDKFVQMLMQIVKESNNIKRNPVFEALEILDCFLEELDEFYGLAALKYGSEARRAMNTLNRWYDDYVDREEVIEYLLDMLEEEHMGMRAVAIEAVRDEFGIEL